MSERIELSEHSWIEYDFLYTSDIAIATQWKSKSRPIESNLLWTTVWTPNSAVWNKAARWRIPISELSAIYDYREGEPWSCCPKDGSKEYLGNLIYAYESNEECRIDRSYFISLHLDAVTLCAGIAESFRKLWEVIKEVEG